MGLFETLFLVIFAIACGVVLIFEHRELEQSRKLRARQLLYYNLRIEKLCYELGKIIPDLDLNNYT